MSNTEQMRDDFERWYVEHCPDITAEPTGCRTFTLQWEAWQAALTAPAAEVPEAMGDERESFEAWIAKDGGDLSTFGTHQNKHYSNSAVNNAWIGWKKRASIGQSTRLRGGVPEGMALVPLKADVALLRPFHSCPPEELELAWDAAMVVARRKLTAAPQAPALDAGVVRDAVLAEREACAQLMERQHIWITNTAASALIRTRHDAAMSAQAGKGGA